VRIHGLTWRDIALDAALGACALALLDRVAAFVVTHSASVDVWAFDAHGDAIPARAFVAPHACPVLPRDTSAEAAIQFGVANALRLREARTWEEARPLLLTHLCVTRVCGGPGLTIQRADVEQGGRRRRRRSRSRSRSRSQGQSRGRGAKGR
jgi:hypothetical protein